MTHVGSAPPTPFPVRISLTGISMDGKGRWIDNVFIERLWRTVKHENVYLRAYRDGGETRTGLTAYFAFYNAPRPHQFFHRQHACDVRRL
jgi:hypothetical protein